MWAGRNAPHGLSPLLASFRQIWRSSIFYRPIHERLEGTRAFSLLVRNHASHSHPHLLIKKNILINSTTHQTLRKLILEALYDIHAPVRPLTRHVTFRPPLHIHNRRPCACNARISMYVIYLLCNIPHWKYITWETIEPSHQMTSAPVAYIRWI